MAVKATDPKIKVALEADAAPAPLELVAAAAVAAAPVNAPAGASSAFGLMLKRLFGLADDAGDLPGAAGDANGNTELPAIDSTSARIQLSAADDVIRQMNRRLGGVEPVLEQPSASKPTGLQDSFGASTRFGTAQAEEAAPVRTASRFTVSPPDAATPLVSAREGFTRFDRDGDIAAPAPRQPISVRRNSDPTASDDRGIGDEDRAIKLNLLANDRDFDGDKLSVSAVTNGANGTVAINADGTVTYTPNANYNGADKFTYTVSDGQGGARTATVAVNVSPVNDGPVAADDKVATGEDTAVTLNVLANDTDIDGDKLTVASVTNGANGKVAINADGTVTYTPNANFNGADKFTYTVSDGQGGVHTATVAVNVSPANDAPVAVADKVATAEDIAVTLNVLANDTDIDGDKLSVSTVTNGANGTVAINADGTVTYTPNANYNGADKFTYTVSDGQGGVHTATVAVNVSPVNDAPVAVADVTTTGPGGKVVVNVLANDSDVDGGKLTVSSATNGANGKVAINADGTVTYTANTGFSGTDKFTYTVSDGQGGSATATATVHVGKLILGNDNNNSLTGLAGDDDIYGFNGNDTINAGDGNNRVWGGEGNDKITTGAGNDTIDGGKNNDTINSGAGNDFITGGSGADTINAGAGNDTIVWDRLDNLVSGGEGIDTLQVSDASHNFTSGMKPTGVEVIDLRGAGAHVVTLSAESVLDMSDNDTLKVLGESGDSVNAGKGWTDGGFNGAGQHVYTKSVGGAVATLVVDSVINVNPDITST